MIGLRDAAALDPVAALAVGDRHAWFNAHVLPYEPRLRRYLQRSFPSLDPDDLIQDTFVRIYRAHPETPIGNLQAYLFMILRRLALDAVLRRQRRPFTTLSHDAAERLLDPAPSVPRMVMAREEAKDVAALIEYLPPRCREVFKLRRLEACPPRAVAQKLGISERTVEIQLSLGQKRCRELFRLRQAGWTMEALRPQPRAPRA